MSQNVSAGPSMTGEVRVKIPLILLPIIVLAVIGLATFGFSRVLLALDPEVATTVAVVMSANLLGACTFIALRPRSARRRWAELTLVVIYPVLVGIALAQTGYGKAEAEAPAAAQEGGGSEGAAAGGIPSALVAVDVQFDTTKMTAEAGEEVSFTFENEDPTAHNFAVFGSDADAQSQSNEIFKTSDVPGGGSEDVSFSAPEDPGDYPYLCTLHPTTMTGTLTVEAGGGGGGGGSGGGQGQDSTEG